ncbi:hypothetical protein FHS26_004277 [Rhizobium pisi]|uniref:Uncharacterized protein n=1 Tax=Rhizobium pisi TaxID=574561 RepID=A0A7W5BP17_9HYPH|nr:hypothetical protein [Rhizobium pisi]
MKPCPTLPQPAACASIILNWGEFAQARLTSHCIFVSYECLAATTEI